MNRFFGVLATLLCVLVVSVVQAQGPPPPGGRPPGRGGRGPGGPGGGFGFQPPPFPLLEALDADQDGKLSKEEVENAVAALKKLDKDADGKLSKEEIGWPPEFMGRGGPGGPGMGFGGPGFGPGGPGGFGGGPGGNIVERIMSNDKNADGKVTQEELPEAMQRIMPRADANKDGAIDKPEAEAMAATLGRRGGFGGGPPGAPGGFGGGPGGNVVERIMSNDKNADGKVTQEELPEAMQRIMSRADTNKDGAIDKVEAEALAKAMSQRGGVGRGPGAGGEPPEQPKRPRRDGE
jgi:hypothetical protein